MLTLRPYQLQLVDQAREAIRDGARSVLIQLPTGGGKSVIAAYILSGAVQRGKRGWFVNHRRELVQQSANVLIEAANLPTAILAAGFPTDKRQPVQVCSIQSLRTRHDKYPPPDIIVLDECHHSPSATWSALIDAYPNAILLGITATPERLDGTGLGKWFKRMIVGPSVSTLIADGFLSDYKLYAPTGADLSGVHTVAGEFNRGELSAAMEKSAVTGDAVTEYRAKASGKRAIAFVWSVQASEALAARFRAADIPAEHIDGGTDDRVRDAAMHRFRTGETLVLCNCELLGEGIDVPAVEAVILLRPTMSRGLYMQQIGRGLRPAPGKSACVILDHANNCKRHGLPDDEREWTLDGRERSRASREAPIRQCGQCFAVVPAASTACRYCGTAFGVTPREVEEIAGTLQEVDAVAARAAKHHALRAEVAQARDRAQLQAIAQARGYQPSWVDYILRARHANRARKPVSPYDKIKEMKGEM